MMFMVNPLMPEAFKGIAFINEYPLGDLEAKLEPEVMEALSEYNLHEMSCKELHQALFTLRDKLKLRPWHILTAVFQSYGYAAFRRELVTASNKITKDQAWCVGSGGKRPLLNFYRRYNGIHEVSIMDTDRKAHPVGLLIERLDTEVEPYFWSYQTERLLRVRDGGSKMEVPFIRLVGSNIGTLENWKLYADKEGNICVPIRKRALKKKTTRKKAQVKEETPDLPNLTVDETPVEHPLSDEMRRQRIQILVLMQSVLSPKLFNLYALGQFVEVDTAKELIAQLDKPLKAYVALLASGRPVEERLPDDLVLVCKSITDMGVRTHAVGGVVEAVTLWYKKLTFTDTSRVFDMSM